MSQLVQVEAYLGPEKPETLAEAVVAFYNGKLPEYGVVRQDRESGRVDFHGAYTSERAALSAVNALNTNRGFGILCNLRCQVVEVRAEQEQEQDLAS